MTAITRTPKKESDLSATVRRSKYLRLDEDNPLYGYLYVIPFLIFFAAFTVYPIFRGLQVSFADWDVVNPPRFIGLENYKRLLLQDRLFITCLKNTVSYVVMYVPLGILVPMLLAELLFKPIFGRAFFRSSFALPIMIFSVINVISLNIDKIMIGYFWTSVEVGYYFTIQQVLQIITVFYIAVSVVLLPTISKFHSNNNLGKIKKTMHLAERYISMIMIPPIIVVIVLAEPVINIMLDSTFLPASTVLITLSIYFFIFSINRPYGSLISGINKPGVSTKIGILICLVNIPLNFLFIPENGLLSSFGINGPTGAALATVISTFVGFFGLRIAAKKLTGVKIFQTHTPRHIIAGLIMGLIIYLIAYETNIFPNVYWYILLLYAGLGLGIYLGILYLLKEFNKKDLEFYLDLMHPKEMLKYISSELTEKPKSKE